MRYSIVNGERIEALPKLSGRCHICGCQTIAKCGEIRVWHWAHKGQVCDPWYEKETVWHRKWQDCFPKDWHEVKQERNGQTHVVDIKTAQGWSIKFQYRQLKSEARIERSVFYEKLVWVVNGTRRDRDKKVFSKLLNDLNLVRMKKARVWRVHLDECILLKEWSRIIVPVFFDFGGEDLFCLLPSAQGVCGYIVAFSRIGFVTLHNDAGQQKDFEYWIDYLNNSVVQYESNHFEVMKSHSSGFPKVMQSEMIKFHSSGLPMYLVQID